MVLSKISQSATVVNLAGGKYKELKSLMPATVAEAVEKGTPMVMLEKVTDELSITRYIEFELITMTSMLNMNPGLLLQKHQLPEVAKQLFDNFKMESLEDFSIAFKRGAMGFYNPDGLFRVDGAVVTQWVRAYLEEKYSYIEGRLRKEQGEHKKEETEVDYKAHIERLQMEGTPDERERKKDLERHHNDNAYERFKLNRGGRPKFLCDGLEVQAIDEQKAREQFYAVHGRDPRVVTAMNPEDSVKKRDEEYLKQTNQI